MSKIGSYPKFKHDVDAICFDFGGTLYDVSEAAFKSWQEILLLAGLGLIESNDYYKAVNKARRDFLDQHTAKQVHLGRNPALTSEQWLEYNQKILENLGLTPKYVSHQLCSALTESMEAHIHIYELLPGTRKTLKFLSKYFKLGIISNTSHDLRHYLKRDQILSFFDTLVFSYEVGHWKPDIEIFLHACKELNISPNRVAYVGDQPICDYYGASQASLVPILLDRHGESFKFFHAKVNMFIIRELHDITITLGV